MTDIDSRFQTIVQRIDQERDQPSRGDRLIQFAEAVQALGPLHFSEVVLVAGTNGKGTVSKTLETLLQASGQRVGLYTSPHMIDTTERIRSGGQNISREEFVACYERLESVIQKFGLSHFEILTLMMVEVFFGGRIRMPVDIAVIEVGVGGRLDPTRVIPHQFSVITRIGLDHQDLLGSRLEQIASEKFAIVDEGNTVIHATLPAAALSALRERQGKTKARYIEAPVFGSRVISNGDEPKWILEAPWGEAPLSLMGQRAVQNTSVALTVLTHLRPALSVAPLLPHLAHVDWPCRMERFDVSPNKRVYLSGDHNVQGAESLREIIKHFHYHELHLIVGMAKNKDVDAALSVFSEIPRCRISLTVTPFRGAGPELYGEWQGRATGGFYSDPMEAVRASLARARQDDLIVVTGSLYLVGTLRGRLLH